MNVDQTISNPFFDRPILNSPYARPTRHWELDEHGQPTQKILEARRRAEFITPIPKPKKRKHAIEQEEIVFDEGKGLSTKEQQYDPTSVINEVRGYVDTWRSLPNANQWQVTPETARLLQHWRDHNFSGFRPFFCQIEALETAIWLTEFQNLLHFRQARKCLACLFGCCLALQLDCNKVAFVASSNGAPLKWDMHDYVRPDLDAVMPDAFLVFLLDNRIVRQDAVTQARIQFMEQFSLEATLITVQHRLQDALQRLL